MFDSAVKYIFPLFFSFFFTLISSAQCNELSGTVVRVIDGDTIVIVQDQEQYRIRLYGIDAPESNQPFGEQASIYTSILILGKNVQVDVKETDRYGRTVGFVYLADKNINKELILAGYAWVYPDYCKDTMCREFIYLQRRAKKKRIGLWNQISPTPPWKYRKQNHRHK